MEAGSIPVRATSARSTAAARSSGRTRASAPPCRPTGVRTASTITASFARSAMGHSGTIATASISTSACGSSSPATTTRVIAG